MMAERGLDLVHTTIMRWVHDTAPQSTKKLDLQIVMLRVSCSFSQQLK